MRRIVVDVPDYIDKIKVVLYEEPQVFDGLFSSPTHKHLVDPRETYCVTYDNGHWYDS